MIIEEDNEPKPSNVFTPLVLDTMSIDQLKNYIRVLKEEMRRVQCEISKKSTLMQEAESLFKS
tara:strand:+ start:3554 stop:3742 length:189 start_codon:yes stop_codon:yes gene_type:complete